MNINDVFKMQICWAADDSTGGGGGGGEGAGGGGGGGEGAGGGGGGGEGAGEGAAKWWEGDKFSDDQRTSLTALGLTVDDPLEAVAKLTDMEKSAKQRLGANPNDLLTKPKEGQNVSEWLRENGEMLGIPDAADKYEVDKPEFWPKEMPWDDALEGKARNIAHEEGISGKGLNRLVELFAQNNFDLNKGADDALAAANAEMMTALEVDWGDQKDAKLAEARQAMGVVAEAAGMDAEAQFNMIDAIAKKGGDANTWKFMSQLASMMGEDSLAGHLQGAKELGKTPAEARAELEQMRSPDGAWFKAVNSRDQNEISRLKPIMDNLTKISA